MTKFYEDACLLEQPFIKNTDIKVNDPKSFKTSLKSNAGLSAALGYKFSFLRAEAELQYFKAGTGGLHSAEN